MLLHHLILFSRPGCHLCDEMKAVVERVAGRVPLEIQQIDISGDPELERLYGEQVPALTIDGRKAAKYRISEDELMRKLERAVGEDRGPGTGG